MKSKFLSNIVLLASLVPIAFIFAVKFDINIDDKQFDKWIILVVAMNYYCLALIAFYIIRTDLMPKGNKRLWIVIILLFNVVAFPIFWYKYIWVINSSKIELS